jgi:hypothetical protein
MNETTFMEMSYVLMFVQSWVARGIAGQAFVIWCCLIYSQTFQGGDDEWWWVSILGLRGCLYTWGKDACAAVGVEVILSWNVFSVKGNFFWLAQVSPNEHGPWLSMLQDFERL